MTQKTSALGALVGIALVVGMVGSCKVPGKKKVPPIKLTDNLSKKTAKRTLKVDVTKPDKPKNKK